MVAEEATPDVAGYGGHDDLLARAMIGGRADHHRRAEFLSRLIGEDEADQHHIAPATGGHTPRPSGCPRGQLAPGPPSLSGQVPPPPHPPDLPAGAPPPPRSEERRVGEEGR